MPFFQLNCRRVFELDVFIRFDFRTTHVVRNLMFSLKQTNQTRIRGTARGSDRLVNRVYLLQDLRYRENDIVVANITDLTIIEIIRLWLRMYSSDVLFSLNACII